MHRIISHRRVDWCSAKFTLVSVILGIVFLTSLNFHYASGWTKAETTAPKEIQFEDHKVIERILSNGEILEVVHIDLKGTPPKISYLIRLLYKLNDTNVRAVMIEYDDMFPYHKGLLLDAITPEIAYTEADIKKIVETCEELDIEIIPMIQTFDHMEHVLKLAIAKNFLLREHEGDYRTICPSRPNSIKLIKEMIANVLESHPYSRRIHIGCGQGTSIKICDKCMDREDSPDEIFVKHVKAVAGYINRVYDKKITPLIWDDMLRPMTPTFLNESKLNDYVEVVIRNSGLPFSKALRIDLWFKYTQVFDRIWVAGAFRGADGDFSLMPDLRLRFQNQYSWITIILGEVSNVNATIVGYILTGDSKIDHLASSIDILPVSIPSLIMNVLLVKTMLRPHEKRFFNDEYNNLLDCKPRLSATESFNMKLLKRCTIGRTYEYDVIEPMLEFQELQPKIEKMHKNLHENNAWATPYHMEKTFLNPAIIENLFRRHRYYEIYHAFWDTYSRLENNMKNFHDDYFVKEWIQQHVYPYLKKIKDIVDLKKKIENLDTLLRRD